MSGGRTAGSHRRVDRLFDEALDQPAERRLEWLRARTGGDEELYRKVRDLLAALDSEAELIEARGGLSGPLVDRMVSERTTEPESFPPAPPVWSAGDRIGTYEIVELLDEGGMGRVYRARDHRLGRDVALKSLSEGAGSPHRLQRFEREARLLAALNHPNIAAIYDLEVFQDAPILVLELVDGETLADLLRGGPLELPRALDIARQIAEALEEAHDHGIVHRDLKPSNVKLTERGRVKVLDFGIAKMEAPTSEVEGVSVPAELTREGVVLGTASYMSPEQVRGERLDARSDIWSFGCLLYEMLAGRRAFHASTRSETMAAVLREPVDWGALPSDTPVSVLRTLRRCLAKDPERRLRHVADARLDLEDSSGESDSLEMLMGGRPLVVRRRLLRRGFVWGALLGAVAVAAAWLWLGRTGGGGREPRTGSVGVRFALDLPAEQNLVPTYQRQFALAPDGRSIVYIAAADDARRLYRRPFAELSARPLPGTEGALYPFLSPDGRWLGFFSDDRRLKKLDLERQVVIDLAEIGGNPRGGTWTDRDTIVLAESQTSGLVELDTDGREIRGLTDLDPVRGERSHRWPAGVPGRDWVVFTLQEEGTSFDEAAIEAVSVVDGERRRLVEQGSFPVVASEHLYFVRRGQLVRRRLAAGSREEIGLDPGEEILTDAVWYASANGGAQFDVARDGSLAWVPGVPSPWERRLLWVGRDGALEPGFGESRMFRSPALSPDGQTVALVLTATETSQIWLVSLQSRTLSQLSYSTTPARRPIWSPDGRAVTYSRRTEAGWALVEQPVDGGRPTVLLESPYHVYANTFVEGDSGRRSLVYQELRPDTGWDLLELPLSEDGVVGVEPRLLLSSPVHEFNARVSPDGRFVAYESDELDRVVEIYVRRWPDLTGKVRVSRHGARWAVWCSADSTGGELAYWTTGEGRLSSSRYRIEDGDFLVEEATGILDGVLTGPDGVRVVVAPSYAGIDYDRATDRFLALGMPQREVPPFQLFVATGG